MTLDERIRRHLDESTSSLKAPHRLEEVMAEGRRRNARKGTFTVLGAAAAVAAVVTILPFLSSDTATPPAGTDAGPTASDPVSSTAAPPAMAGTEPYGVLVAGTDGVSRIDTSGNTTSLLASSTDVVVAFPDQRGGVVYQRAPATGDDRILRLTPGETAPIALVTPVADEGAIPIGPGRSPSGAPIFFYLRDDSTTSTVVAIDLASGDTTDVADLPPATNVSAGGSVLALVDRSDSGCPTLGLLHLERGELPSPLDGCLPTASGVTVSADGRAVAILSGDSFQVLDRDGGEVLMERNVPDAYMATAGPGGWAIRTPAETVLLAAGGSSWSLPPVGEREWAIPYAQPFELSDGATPGSEADACPAGGSDLPDQNLPDEVAATRRQLWDLATSCDSAGLADLARTSETILSVGGEVDPAEYWDADADSGQNPMTILAQLLATRPTEDPEADLWAWPAVQVDPDDDESWAEMADILGEEQVNEMRQAGTGYLGYRVGISSDGRWQYFVAGD